MLVLTRKVDEQIVVGDDVRITVLEIRGGKVKLGFECDGKVSVHRLEVFERIQSERQMAEPAAVAASR